MPLPGGTMRKLSNAFSPHLRKANRSLFRWNSRASFYSFASAERAASTWMEWSITRSAYTSGLIFAGSPPRVFIVVRIAARSTTAGTPVKSYSRTRAGLNGISTSCCEVSFHAMMRSTSLATASVVRYGQRKVCEQLLPLVCKI